MLIEKGFIEELQSEVFLYDLDGLKVVFVDKECDEFAFNGTIYNRHRDNKGLPHMVEHCIFGGSLNFDFDEPFEYLVQNKRYTYLNAITFRDRTVCPFSTYSRKDFDEILDVYLDSIFNPFLREKTFRQECVRFDENTINGIVNNEMVEMYSDKNYAKEDRLLSLFDCNYLKYNAHGNPSTFKNVSYNDMMDYYHKNFSRDNIILSFYGKFEHEEYLSKIEEIAGLCNKRSVLDFEISESLEIKVNKEKTTFDVVIAYEAANKAESDLLEIFFEYLIFSEIKEFRNELSKQFHIKSLNVSKNKDLRKNLIFIYIEHSGDREINLSDIIKIFEKLVENYDKVKIDNIFLKNAFVEKNSDYGYKTNGVYSLLEISKQKADIFNFYKSKEIDFNESKISQDKELLDLVKLIMAFNGKIGFKKVHKHDNCSVNTKKCNILKKNFDNSFIYSTEYDIINAVIVINYDKIGFLGNFDLSKVDINNEFFENVDFVRGFYSSRMQSETHEINGFYLHISLLEKSIDEGLAKLYKLFCEIKYEDLFKVKESILSYNLSINEIIAIVTNTQSEAVDLRNEDNGTNSSSFTLDYYLIVDDTTINKIKSEKLQLRNFEKYNNQELRNTTDFESELFKNILVLKLVDDCDFLYLELILEALVNEKLYNKVRLLNGAYEVGYKILKLEKKVVLFSNIDRFSEKTLNTFKIEFEKLDYIKIEQFIKYLNKITNNFYRNEQNKNIKTKKIFENYLLNIADTISEFNQEKLEIALRVLKNSQVEYEFSFGKESFRDYKNGGIYVY